MIFEFVAAGKQLIEGLCNGDSVIDGLLPQLVNDVDLGAQAGRIVIGLILGPSLEGTIEPANTLCRFVIDDGLPLVFASTGITPPALVLTYRSYSCDAPYGWSHVRARRLRTSSRFRASGALAP